MASNGDCYEANGGYMMERSMDKFSDGDLILCHGTAILQTDGKPFGHCWLEKGNMVFDFSNGKNLAISKKDYYKLGGMPVKGHKIYKYTWEKARKEIVGTGHWGPWPPNKPPR